MVRLAWVIGVLGLVAVLSCDDDETDGPAGDARVGDGGARSDGAPPIPVDARTPQDGGGADARGADAAPFDGGGAWAVCPDDEPAEGTRCEPAVGTCAYRFGCCCGAYGAYRACTCVEGRFRCVDTDHCDPPPACADASPGCPPSDAARE
ncbi:MAG: hypothetical protein H6704_12430 [Myxococcales bacterium]|nr:hypothetical protein [Myxococcales bacterium]